MRVDLVVAHVEVALQEPAVVVREEASHRHIVAGERVHVVDRVEEEERDELCELAVAPAEDDRAAAAGELAGSPHPARLEVLDVGVLVGGAGRAAPDPRDHDSSARWRESQPEGEYASPAAAAAPTATTTVPSALASAVRLAAGSLTHTHVPSGASTSSPATV